MLPSEKRAIILAEIRKHPEGISAQQMANSNLINLRIKDRNVVISTYYETAHIKDKKKAAEVNDNKIKGLITALGICGLDYSIKAQKAMDGDKADWANYIKAILLAKIALAYKETMDLAKKERENRI